MSGTFIRIAPNGLTSRHRSEARGSWPLKMAQDLVGGYVERIKVKYEGKMRDALVDGEGMMKRLPINQEARRLHLWHEPLAGTVVIWVPDPKKPKAEIAKDEE